MPLWKGKSSAFQSVGRLPSGKIVQKSVTQSEEER